MHFILLFNSFEYFCCFFFILLCKMQFHFCLDNQSSQCNLWNSPPYSYSLIILSLLAVTNICFGTFAFLYSGPWFIHIFLLQHFWLRSNYCSFFDLIAGVMIFPVLFSSKIAIANCLPVHINFKMETISGRNKIFWRLYKLLLKYLTLLQ